MKKSIFTLIPDFASECGIMSKRVAQKDANECAEKSWDSPHFSSKNCGQSRFFCRYSNSNAKSGLIMFLFFTLIEIPCFPAEKSPQRIISLGPAVTEEIYLLGAEDKLIGCTSYCQRPEEAKRMEKVGAVIEINAEKIAFLKPDLIIAASLTNPKDIKKLENLKLNVIVIPASKNFTEICLHFSELGKITGKEKEAADIIRKTNAKVHSIETRVKGLTKPKVFVQAGAKPLYTACKDSFVNDYITRAGGINIAADLKEGADYSVCSREQVLRENPDVIIIITMGIAGENEKNIWKRFKILNAAVNDRIYIIDSYKLCSPTPVSFAEMLEEIADILHPVQSK